MSSIAQTFAMFKENYHSVETADRRHIFHDFLQLGTDALKTVSATDASELMALGLADSDIDVHHSCEVLAQQL